MDRELFRNNILELIRRTSAFLPPDVEGVIELQRRLEPQAPRPILPSNWSRRTSAWRRRGRPHLPGHRHHHLLLQDAARLRSARTGGALREAVAEATAKGYLRQNSVDSVTGQNTGNNLGPGSPVFHWHQTREATHGRPPDPQGRRLREHERPVLAARRSQGKRVDRDLEGVRACILDAVWKAQGKGCGPGFLGVCDRRRPGHRLRLREEAAAARTWTTRIPIRRWPSWRRRILEEANKLDIGPMGFGGKLTVGGCKVGARNRLPASFFVSVAYMCWAYRRRGVVLDAEGDVVEWLYQAPDEFAKRGADAGSHAAGRATCVRSADAADARPTCGSSRPATWCCLRDCLHRPRRGSQVPARGRRTGRPQGRRHLSLRSGRAQGRRTYRVMAAGPTTSIREEPYQADIIKRFGIKAVIGKGGMGREDAEGVPGARLRLPARHRRRGPDLCAMRPARVERPPGAVRQPGGGLGAASEELPGRRRDR